MGGVGKFAQFGTLDVQPETYRSIVILHFIIPVFIGVSLIFEWRTDGSDAAKHWIWKFCGIGAHCGNCISKFRPHETT